MRFRISEIYMDQLLNVSESFLRTRMLHPKMVAGWHAAVFYVNHSRDGVCS